MPVLSEPIMRHAMTPHHDPVKARPTLRSPAHILERRKSQRLTMRFPLKWRVRGSSRWQAAMCENLSGGGLGLCVEDPCPDQATIEVILMPPEVEPHGFTAVAPLISAFGRRAEPLRSLPCFAKASQRHPPCRLPPRAHARGFRRRRVKFTHGRRTCRCAYPHATDRPCR